MPSLTTWLCLGVMSAHFAVPGCQDRHSASDDTSPPTTMVPTTVPPPTPGMAPAPGTVPLPGTPVVPGQPTEPMAGAQPPPGTPPPPSAPPSGAPTGAYPTQPTFVPAPHRDHDNNPNRTYIPPPIQGLPGVTVQNNPRGHETDINVGGIRIQVPQAPPQQQ